MTVAWPPHLIERIAENQWVLFIGSGVSASCKNSRGGSPPDWRGLLLQLCRLIPDEASRRVGTRFIRNRELVAAADHIRHALDQAGNLQGYYSTIRAAVEGPPSDKYGPSPLLQVLLDLEPRIVFTTNYDKLFETASENGFATHQFSTRGLSDDLRRGEPVLVKLHGTTDAINDIVLTRTDYARVMRDGKLVFDVLNALSLTSTILFVGYSLDDPDIQLVLQSVGRLGLSPEAHFMLTSEPRSPSRIPVFKESYGVTVLPYSGGRRKGLEALMGLGNAVLSLREHGSATPA